jgi:hypothetical protein
MGSFSWLLLRWLSCLLNSESEFHFLLPSYTGVTLITPWNEKQPD